MDLAHPTVLVVDDEPDALELLAACLESRGCDVKTACDGEEALDVLRGGDVGLVISDIMMPRMDGLALCDQMRTEPRLRSIPVVLVSALFGRGPQDVTTEQIVGAFGKPVDLDALLAMVHDTVGC